MKTVPLSPAQVAHLKKLQVDLNIATFKLGAAVADFERQKLRMCARIEQMRKEISDASRQVVLAAGLTDEDHVELDVANGVLKVSNKEEDEKPATL